jgi:hypothetical protein
VLRNNTCEELFVKYEVGEMVGQLDILSRGLGSKDLVKTLPPT